MTSRRAPSRFRSADDGGFRFWTAAFAVLVILIVAAIGVELFRNSTLPIRKFGWKFWTASDWDPVSGEFGALPFIWGTVYSSVFAIVLATPIALGIAIFDSEISPARFRKPLAFLTELLAAIPSIVYGLWGIFVLVPMVRKMETIVSKTPLAKLPIFRGAPFGIGMLAAGLILTVMVIPFISSVAREVLRAVPMAQREAAYALGATRWEAIKVALRFGRTGILGAIILGFGRAFGETMAVTMVIGNSSRNVNFSLFTPGYTMASAIANQFREADKDIYFASIVNVALVLLLISGVVNGLARLIVWQFAGRAMTRA